MDGMYIDAVVTLGNTMRHSVSITVNENAKIYSPFNLNGYKVRFRILGSPTSDAKVLKEYIITQSTDMETQGQIDNPDEGQFVFVVPAEDTIELGLGSFPIELALLDETDDVVEYIITEGGLRGEFNRINIVQV